jgi:hypothetical protein
MTAERLALVAAAHVLNPTPVGEDVVRFYVEFDDLLQAADAEAALRRAVEANHRIAVVGRSGVGKSSLIEWVLGSSGEGYASIRVPVAVENDETIEDPIAFAQHVIRTVSKHALEAQLITSDERNLILRASNERIIRPGREVTHRQGLKFPDWMLGGNLARDVHTHAESVDQSRSGAQIIDALEYVIRLIQEQGLRPVFVIDDSDTWLSIPGVGDRSHLVASFFDRVLRMLAERPAGLVVAVHESYRKMEGYRRAQGFLETEVHVPLLSTTEHIVRLLDHRLSGADDALRTYDIFEEAGIAELFAYYVGEAAFSIRKVLQAAQSSVQVAASQSDDRVGAARIEAAIAEWI